MSKQTLDAPLTLSTDNGSASPFTTLDDFFSTAARPQETAVIAGKTCHFEGMSAAAKDHLIGFHSRDDGEGNVSVENKQWRTNVIAESWVTAFGGTRVLAKKEDIDRFYKTIPAQIEQAMYEVAARVSGLGDTEKRRKNSGAAGGSSTSPTSA